MKLVIAEKPSVAQSIAAVLGATQRREGYLEGGGWLVSWCVGHLVGLADAGTYEPAYAKWRWEDLPILPSSWRFTVSKDKREQFEVLRGLMRRDDVTEVVNACDAGREGELVFRTAYHLAGCGKPMKRLWISSMENIAIREGFDSLKPGRDYDGLHQAALCRAKADWLVGINATRLFSILYGRTLNIGRVVSPTLALIVQREAEIAAFKPQPFYTVELDCGGVTVTGERTDGKTEAETAAAACRGSTATVKAVERKEWTEKPPALYELTTLQREANRILGYTAQQTLDYLQSLYEKKLCTYPRTDSRYLTTDMAETACCVLHMAARVPPFDACGSFFPDMAPLISDKDVTDHHAIIPTMEIEKADITALPAGERNLLILLCCRLLCAAAEPYTYEAVSVTFDCGGYIFTVKDKHILSEGWREIDRIYRTSLKEKPEDEEGGGIPDFNEGQIFPVEDARVKVGKTNPPPHYNEDRLLAAMETAGVEDMPEDAERRGIGTPATRAGILEKLVSTGLVERKKSKKVVNLLPTRVGTALITVLPEQLQSPLLTAEWEHRLLEVEHGTLDPDAFLDGIAAMLKELVNTYTPVPGAAVLFPIEGSVGQCPRCGGAVTEGKKGFSCQNPACKFILWKDNRFFTAKKKTLTKSVAAALLKDGRAKLTGCWSEKTGKIYDATVVLEDNCTRTNFKLEFGHG